MQPYSYPSLSPIPLALAKALRVSDAKLVKGDGGEGEGRGILARLGKVRNIKSLTQFPPTQAPSQRQTVSSSRINTSPLRNYQRLLEIPSSCHRVSGDN